MTDAGGELEPELKKVSMAEVIASGARVARAKVGLDQEQLSARMRTLGTPWRRQTVSAVERGERRVAAEELLPLSLALETSMADLLAPGDPSHRRTVIEVGDKFLSPGDVSLSAGIGFPSLLLRWLGDRPVWAPRSLVEEAAREQAVFLALQRREAHDMSRAGAKDRAWLNSVSTKEGMTEFIEVAVTSWLESAPDISPEVREATLAAVPEVVAQEWSKYDGWEGGDSE